MNIHWGHPSATGGRPGVSSEQAQLRQDRWTATIILLIIVALLAAVTWLAGSSGGEVQDSLQHWPLMP